jgi:hypothetical protein
MDMDMNSSCIVAGFEVRELAWFLLNGIKKESYENVKKDGENEER